MGEAEDVVFGRQRKASQISAEEMEEFQKIKASIKKLIPVALANLRKHNYPPYYLMRTISYNNEMRVAWRLWTDNDSPSSDIYLLGEGELVIENSLGKLSAYTISPKPVCFCKVNEIAKDIMKSLQRLSTEDFK